MDPQSFDALIRATTQATTRRGALGLLTGAAFSGLSWFDQTEAKPGRRKKKGKQQHRHKKRDHTNQNPPPPPSDPPPLPPPAPVTRIDAACSDSTGAFLIRDGDERIAQTFTAIGNGALVRAEVEIFKVPGTSGDYILLLHAVDGSGFPTNEVLAESVVANARVPDFQPTLSFSFANPATVAAGTQYALVLTRPGSNQLEWIGSFGVPCSGSAFTSPNQTAAFEADDTGIDLTFTTFVSS